MIAPMRLILPILLLTLSGCAAMKRSWEFSASAVESPLARVDVDAVMVRQKDLSVKVRLRVNAGGTLRLGDPKIRAEGGGEFKGHASVWTGSPVVFLKPEDEAIVGPGQTVELRLWFHSASRDLRRAPVYTLELGGTTLNGALLELPPLRLVAPPDAPMGDGV